jgi:cyclic beta-1,2-glucan synthetase
VTLAVYLLAHVGRLSTAGKGIGAAGAALLAGAPYVLGGLTLLEAGGLLDALGGDSPVPGYFGRMLVVFLFNVLLAEGLGAVSGRPLRSARAFGAMLAAAAAVAAGPWVASFGSGPALVAWSPAWRAPVVVLCGMLAQAGLWAEAYLCTGLAIDAVNGRAPTAASVLAHPWQGVKKGMIYSGTFLAALYVVATLAAWPTFRDLLEAQPRLVAATLGALAWPLVKTIFESFDGSSPFLERLARSYRDPWLAARGAVVGLGLATGVTGAMSERDMATRAGFGFLVGATAYGGVDAARDALRSALGRGSLQAPRFYGVRVILGGLIGAAIGFYLDAAQLAIVIAKFERYTSVGRTPEPFGIYPLVSKWGFMNLGTVQGGADLLFAEALAGVLSWSTAAWLFALNRTFMAAGFERQAAPIRGMFSAAGLRQLAENSIQVARWGLWMSPIINSFLRPMGEPTWYNQDGALRTIAATFQSLTTSPDAFRAWSLQMFIYLLAYDAVRVLIWIDHMGLRVATLVNLSFLGVDAGERKLARYLAPSSTARCIPEAVKRFATWAPLLLPFYIPRGADWDRAWSAAETLSAQGGDRWADLLARPLGERLGLLALAVLALSLVVAAVRLFRRRFGELSPATLTLKNAAYELSVREDGAIVGRSPSRDQDVSRRSYDLLDPAGRAFYLMDEDGEAAILAGNPPGAGFEPGQRPWARRGDALVTNRADDVLAELTARLPDADDSVELWSLKLVNGSDRPRRFRVVPYLEWVLNKPEADRNHTQYNRLFAEMEYVEALHAVLAWDKHAKAMGFLAVDRKPEGFLTSRMDFLGRARGVGDPRALETLDFMPARDEASHPTLDPIASLLVELVVPPNGEAEVRFLIGLATDKAGAVDLIAKHLDRPDARAASTARTRKERHRIGHGEVPRGTPSPYAEFSEDGSKLLVRTPFTPRPFDHTMSNVLGHVLVVTNRGLHTSASVNAQQNRLTPDWSDIVTKEVPSEAIYLFEPATGEWFSPTYHPLNDPEAATEAEFGVDGAAVLRMTKGTIETELTAFVPFDEPTGVYLLTVRNRSRSARRLRLGVYFQLVLADRPEHSGRLLTRVDPTLGAVFFTNPRNTFRTGPAFAACSGEVERIETTRGRFFGRGRALARPYLVEHGEPDVAAVLDDRPVAGLLSTLDVPAMGEHTVVVVLGQADDRRAAEAVVRKFQDVADAEESLEATRRWWTNFRDTLRVESASPEFDAYVDWLKYQALAERIWSRRGFYQASGAYGFRDQLQDSVNLIWADPAIARKQILLHASQQFLEGDVVHWFHLLQDGRTGFVGRSHASDNLLWLAWAVVDYLDATGDASLLDERTPYLESEQPFEPLPEGKHGMGFDPIRSTRSDTVYEHCLRAIDLVLDRRMGAHGLPLIGTGDWNDGLDEIGSEGRGESVWLGFFLSYILQRFIPTIAAREGALSDHYASRLSDLNAAIERTWRGDRYLRAIHDDGTEIGVKGSGVWEIDALTAAWAVMARINPERGRIVFETALAELERDDTILLGTPPLREDTHPYLGRSSWYPEGVRENGMYCHGVQWLVGAARILADQARERGDEAGASAYAETALRLWKKVAAVYHATSESIETYGGQPNKQAADMVTTFDPGRMIWNGYTGAAGWMFRQAIESVLGLKPATGSADASAATPGDLGDVRVARGGGRTSATRIES